MRNGPAKVERCMRESSPARMYSIHFSCTCVWNMYIESHHIYMYWTPLPLLLDCVAFLIQSILIFFFKRIVQYRDIKSLQNNSWFHIAYLHIFVRFIQFFPDLQNPWLWSDVGNSSRRYREFIKLLLRTDEKFATYLFARFEDITLKRIAAPITGDITKYF